jgi:signal transduction histidine kinase
MQLFAAFCVSSQALAPTAAPAPGPATPHSISPLGLTVVGMAFILIIAATVVAVVLARKLLRDKDASPVADWSAARPGEENPSAFMTASMQGVIEKLRAQERELARLHRAEKERARESERITEEVTRSMPTGLLLLSAKGSITSANPAAETALGMSGMQYRSYAEVLGKNSDLAKMLEACLSRGLTTHRAEVQHTTQSGQVRQLGVTISPIERALPNYARGAVDPDSSSHTAPNATGSAVDTTTHKDTIITGALCLMSDLTELTDLQRQIRFKENLAALGEMSAGIAHEFKNSLATISGYAQLLRQESPDGDFRENADRIIEQTRSLAHVVTEFLRFARPLELSYESVPGRALVDRVVEEIQEQFPSAAIHVAGDFAEIPGDEGLLRQVLLNLVRNAAEATRHLPGRDATVTADEINVTGSIDERAGKKWQRISIADNGSGIPAADLPKVFLPFFTTKSEGTGLGLAVVQKIALQHGGSVEAKNLTETGLKSAKSAHSDPNSHTPTGAEFTLTLPLRQETAAPAYSQLQTASKM